MLLSSVFSSYWLWIILGLIACGVILWVVQKHKPEIAPQSQIEAVPQTDENEKMIQTLFGTPQPSFLDKMKQAVTRTRENLSERIDEVMALTKEIDSSTLDDLEGILLGADLGMKTTQEILSKLRERADRKQIKDSDELKELIKEQVLAILNATPARTGKPAKG